MYKQRLENDCGRSGFRHASLYVTGAIKGRLVDNRSDIYSLGITFYESLTGRVPFSQGDIGYCHIHETPPLPSLLNPDIPEPLEKIIIKSIEKNPENRYQNVREILEDIKRC